MACNATLPWWLRAVPLALPLDDRQTYLLLPPGSLFHFTAPGGGGPYASAKNLQLFPQSPPVVGGDGGG